MNDIPDADFPVGFAQLDDLLSGGFRKGEFFVIQGRNTLRQGPVWDYDKKTIDCTYPPRGPVETQQVLRAYREGWTVICGTGRGSHA